jgi:hypothetical protein
MTDLEQELEQHRRATDKGLLCWVALRFADLWDWIDKRDIDKHLVTVFIMFGTWKLTEWAMGYAMSQHMKTGVEVAAIIAAVTAPYMALQAAAIAFYFKART